MSSRGALGLRFNYHLVRTLRAACKGMQALPPKERVGAIEQLKTIQATMCDRPRDDRNADGTYLLPASVCLEGGEMVAGFARDVAEALQADGDHGVMRVELEEFERELAAVLADMKARHPARRNT